MISPIRLLALMRKEALQILRDPSALLISGVLPVMLLFLFAYAVSLDLKNIRITVVESGGGAASQSLAAAFSGTKTFVVTPMREMQTAREALVAGRERAAVVIPSDLERRLGLLADPLLREPLLQILPDSAQPNTANFIVAYGSNVVLQWLTGRGLAQASLIQTEQRVWYNPEVVSARFLVPGAIAIIMTIIGTLLTSMLVTREWERGTMEALLSTPARIPEILTGKLLPYFLLGLLATAIAAFLAVFVFEVPLRGSLFALLLLSACFLIPALGQGLLISVMSKTQFVAGQAAALSGFLPAFLLSGFLFEIDAMPEPLQLITYLVPARYYVESLQTVFLTGDVWALFLPDMVIMLIIGWFLFTVARFKMRKSLEG